MSSNENILKLQAIQTEIQRSDGIKLKQNLVKGYHLIGKILQSEFSSFTKPLLKDVSKQKQKQKNNQGPKINGLYVNYNCPQKKKNDTILSNDYTDDIFTNTRDFNVSDISEIIRNYQ